MAGEGVLRERLLDSEGRPSLVLRRHGNSAEILDPNLAERDGRSNHRRLDRPCGSNGNDDGIASRVQERVGVELPVIGHPEIARRIQDFEEFKQAMAKIGLEVCRGATVHNPAEARKVLEADHYGLDKVKELVPWMLRNAEGHELSSEFGQKRNTITTRFYRGMRKAANAAGISWY